MQFTLLMVAAAIAMVGAIFHGYVGGRLYMKNIRESQLASLTQSLSLVSWQMFTVLLLVSAITFIVVAWQPHLALMAVPLMGANALGTCLFLVLSLMGHSALIKLPGLYLMGLTALLSGLGIAAT
ncbi:hypothetical protein N9M28_01220 [Luminiphilus sp.]|nr:hypothetical protein [Luminiphilus sp.]MDA9797139.1 hypothetical protein [Luminiphilus sp.]|tara:strand:- start:200 stop:574 length:375 start_codon:yes stop_codon:yes gene_type:complete